MDSSYPSAYPNVHLFNYRTDLIQIWRLAFFILSENTLPHLAKVLLVLSLQTHRFDSCLRLSISLPTDIFLIGKSVPLLSFLLFLKGNTENNLWSPLLSSVSMLVRKNA